MTRLPNQTIPLIAGLPHPHQFLKEPGNLLPQWCRRCFHSQQSDHDGGMMNDFDNGLVVAITVTLDFEFDDLAFVRVDYGDDASLGAANITHFHGLCAFHHSEAI
jgi:hypothetical protein